MRCPHCEKLEIFDVDDPSEYWLMTEMFVYLHGSDKCNYSNETRRTRKDGGIMNTTGTLRTYTYKGLTVYYTAGATIELHDIRDSDGQFVHINYKEQKEIKRHINEQARD